MNRLRPLLPSTILVALVGVGCGSNPSDPDQQSIAENLVDADTSRIAPDAEVPEFDGPWASRFESAYRESTSELQRQVLADGAITEQEIVALQDALGSCLTANGVTGVEFDASGGFGIEHPEGWDDDRAVSVATRCQESSLGSASMLYWEMQRNPQNLNENENMVTCLTRQGLVDPSYTPDQYGQDAPADTLPFDVSDPLFDECASDPLGAGY